MVAAIEMLPLIGGISIAESFRSEIPLLTKDRISVRDIPTPGMGAIMVWPTPAGHVTEYLKLNYLLAPSAEGRAQAGQRPGPAGGALN